MDHCRGGARSARTRQSRRRSLGNNPNREHRPGPACMLEAPSLLATFCQIGGPCVRLGVRVAGCFFEGPSGRPASVFPPAWCATPVFYPRPSSNFFVDISKRKFAGGRGAALELVAVFVLLVNCHCVYTCSACSGRAAGSGCPVVERSVPSVRRLFID